MAASAFLSTLDEEILWSSWATAIAGSSYWLVNDPVQYADVSCTSGPLRSSGVSGSLNEATVVSRPKPDGRRRIEIFPDIGTSTLLQAAVDSLPESSKSLPSSLSAQLLTASHRGDNPYELWAQSVWPWIRRELAAGRAIVRCDLRDYYHTVRRRQISEALLSAFGDSPLVDELLHVTDRLLAAGEAAGAPGRGIPVCPQELFPLVAELVLAELDSEVRSDQDALGYARWVDDLFVAVAPGRVDRSLASLESIVASHGFELNSSKVASYPDLRSFDRESLRDSHQLLDRLYFEARSRQGPSRGCEIHELRQRALGAGPEGARLLKRIYGLAGKLQDPTLQAVAADDLGAHPAAETSIVGYLATMHPESLASMLLRTPAADRYDSTGIACLRCLVASPNLEDAVVDDISRLVEKGSDILHPYSAALAIGVLMTVSAGASDDRRPLLDTASELDPAMARRVAFEFLVLEPSLRASVLARASTDSSAVVQSLAAERHPVPAGDPRISGVRRGLFSWHRVEERLVEALGLGRAPARRFE